MILFQQTPSPSLGIDIFVSINTNEQSFSLSCLETKLDLVEACSPLYLAISTLHKILLQDDNFSLSLLNELSVKYGIQTHLSHAPLPQKLEELREYLRREIKKELKVKILYPAQPLLSPNPNFHRSKRAQRTYERLQRTRSL